MPRVILETFDTFDATVCVGPSSVNAFLIMKMSFYTSLGSALARFSMSSFVSTIFIFLSTLSECGAGYH